MARRIESARNDTVADIARLKDRRHRARTRHFLVEGAREVERALAAGVVPTTLVTADSAPTEVAGDLAAWASAGGAEVLSLTDDAFARLSLRQNPDGVALVAVSPDRSLATAPRLRGVVLLLEGIEKPGNLGALLRTADAMGVSAVIVTGEGTDLENPNVVRASQGSLFSLPVYLADLEEALQRLRRDGVRLVAASPGADVVSWHTDLSGDVALALGTESTGLSPAVEAAADARVKVAMSGGSADSLNVSVAGAIVLYEALRQRAVGR